MNDKFVLDSEFVSQYVTIASSILNADVHGISFGAHVPECVLSIMPRTK